MINKDKDRKEIHLSHTEKVGLEALAEAGDHALKKYIEIVLRKHLKENKLG